MRMLACCLSAAALLSAAVQAKPPPKPAKPAPSATAAPAKSAARTAGSRGSAATGKPTPVTEEAPVMLDPITVEGRSLPVPRVRLNPAYPMEARRRWEEGCVVLRFTVRPDGKTDDFAVLESHPRGVFEKSVIGAVFKWQYDPAPEARTVVELFEFRSSAMTSEPRYVVRNTAKTPIGLDNAGRPRYRLDMQLQGYSPPKCKKRL